MTKFLARVSLLPMPAIGPHLLDLKDLSLEKINSLLHLSQKIKHKQVLPKTQSGTAALLFFEPSTRTRFSFELASHRAGLAPLVFDGVNTSLEKGETIEDTILNIAAMKPQVMVIRCNDSVPMRSLAQQTGIPVVNAGWGVSGHPTQALLDASTLWDSWDGKLQGKKLLIVGDILHSRVAASHFELMPKLGVEIAVSGPSFLMPSADKKIKYFENLDEALGWADAVMVLRIQFERHQGQPGMNRSEYFENYGLSVKRVKALSGNTLLMHPGPINYGIEFEQEILKDPRCVVYKQVEHGTFVRESIYRMILGELE